VARGDRHRKLTAQKIPTTPSHPDTEASYTTLGNLLFQLVSPS
jgi:hypothetical protein